MGLGPAKLAGYDIGRFASDRRTRNQSPAQNSERGLRRSLLCNKMGEASTRRNSLPAQRAESAQWCLAARTCRFRAPFSKAANPHRAALATANAFQRAKANSLP